MKRAVLALMLAAGGAAAQTAPSPQADLDRMFDLLKVAPDEQTAGALETAIRRQWLNLASPAVKLLLQSGLRNLNDNQGQEALDDFDAALDLDGNLVAAWQGRAEARASLGDTAGAERDIAETMRREPRAFAALQDLSRIAEQRKDYRGAYAAWTKALELDPKTPGGEEHLKDLKRRAFGDET